MKEVASNAQMERNEEEENGKGKEHKKSRRRVRQRLHCINPAESRIAPYRNSCASMASVFVFAFEYIVDGKSFDMELLGGKRWVMVGEKGSRLSRVFIFPSSV